MSTDSAATRLVYRARRCVAGLVLFGASWGAAGAQVVHVELPDEPNPRACDGCRIELERIATLGTDLDAFIRTYPIWVAMDRRARIYVTVRPPGDLVQVFDTTGQSLGPIGRMGRGPGEYDLPTAVAFGPRGEVLISDFGVGRLTTLSAGWHFISEASQTVPVVTVLADGRRIGAAALRDARHVGYPLHVLNEHGRITASFGADSVVFRPGNQWRLSRIASACGNRLWTMSLDHYSIDEWDSTLTKRLEFVRSPRWYPHIEQPDDGTLGAPPTPRAMAIREDKHGRLWVLTRVRAKSWQAALGEKEDIGGNRTYYPYPDQGRLFDTMIDVIDIHTRRLLVSQRVRGHFLAILSDNYLAAYREDADGTPLLDVWRVRLRTSMAPGPFDSVHP